MNLFKCFLKFSHLQRVGSTSLLFFLTYFSSFLWPPMHIFSSCRSYEFLHSPLHLQRGSSPLPFSLEEKLAGSTQVSLSSALSTCLLILSENSEAGETGLLQKSCWFQHSSVHLMLYLITFSTNWPGILILFGWFFVNAIFLIVFCLCCFSSNISYNILNHYEDDYKESWDMYTLAKK